jgi:hypothetical protein
LAASRRLRPLFDATLSTNSCLVTRLVLYFRERLRCVQE